jgi:hypothetical protein
MIIPAHRSTTLDDSSRVLQRCRSNSSTCIRDQNASIMALSQQSPTEPIEGTSPESLARWVNAQEANWAAPPDRSG